MKEPSASSPFAALSSQEQKERWICWQSQHQEQCMTHAKPTDIDAKSESVLGAAKPTKSRVREASHHSQYDAVIRRMKAACRSVMAYQSCNAEGNTRQLSSGSEKAEK